MKNIENNLFRKSGNGMLVIMQKVSFGVSVEPSNIYYYEN